MSRYSGLVLCCADCQQPVVFIPGGGYHCVGCNYPPSIQDTRFRQMQDGVLVATPESS